jgi:Rad51
MGFVTATEIAMQRRELLKITTGCKEVDAILEGTLLPSCAPSQCLALLSRAGTKL